MLTSKQDERFLLYGLAGLFLALAFMSAALVVWLGGGSLLALFQDAANALFALNTVQGMWYLTRAAGLMAYLLLWLSTVWGLAVSSKVFDPVIYSAFSYDMHEFLSLFAIGFVVLHIVVLMADQYLPFSLAQLLVPFIAPYRPLWVGVGIIGWYLTLLVTVTFYLRRWIGPGAFRVIHYLSFLAYLGVTAHGWFAGTDTALWSVQWMYLGTLLAIVFLTAYWVLSHRANRPRAVAA